MKEKIKNILFITPSFLTFVFLFVLTVLIRNTNKYYEIIKIISTLLIILLLFVIIQIISFIILLIRDKTISTKDKVLQIIYILLFNIFYVPFFYLHNIKKTNNYKVFKTSYLIITIILYLLSLLLIVTYSFNYDKYKYDNENFKKYVTKDNIVSIEVKDYYNDFTKDTNYDLYLKKDNNKEAIGILNHETNEDYSSDYYLNKYIENIKKDIMDLEEDKKEKKFVINNYDAKEKYYKSKKENDYFIFTSISSNNKTSIILFTTNTNNIINNKDYNDLIKSIKIK